MDVKPLKADPEAKPFDLDTLLDLDTGAASAAPVPAVSEEAIEGEVITAAEAGEAPLDLSQFFDDTVPASAGVGKTPGERVDLQFRMQSEKHTPYDSELHDRAKMRMQDLMDLRQTSRERAEKADGKTGKSNAKSNEKKMDDLGFK